jgi:hypothetical protein
MKYLSVIALLLSVAAHAANPQEAAVSGRVAVQQKEGEPGACTLALIARVLRGEANLLIAGALSADETGIWSVKGAYFEVPKINVRAVGPTIQPIKAFSMQAEGQPVLARTGYANIKTDDVTIKYNTAAEPSGALVRAILQETPVRLSILDADGATEVFRGVAHISPDDKKEMAECMADLKTRMGSKAPGGG